MRYSKRNNWERYWKTFLRCAICKAGMEGRKQVGSESEQGVRNDINARENPRVSKMCIKSVY